MRSLYRPTTVSTLTLYSTCLLGSVLSAVCWGARTPKSSKDEPVKPSLLAVTIRSNEPSNLFIDEAVTPSHPITLSIATVNKTPKAGPIKYEWKLTDYWGKTVRSDSSKSAPVALNATDQLYLSFHRDADLKNKTGIYTFKIMASKGKEKAEAQLGFGVVPRPAPGLREDSRFGVSTHVAEDVALEALQKIGARWVRTSFGAGWEDVESKGKGQYEWDRFDRLSSEARARDLSILPVVGYAPAWARSTVQTSAGLPSVTPGSARDHADFVAAAVARYGREIKYWELWDTPGVMSPGWEGSAQSYRDLLKTDYAAAKRSNPSAVILGSGGDVSQLMSVNFAPGAEVSGSMDDLSARAELSGPPEEAFESRVELAGLLGRKYNKDRVWINGHVTGEVEPETLARYVPRAYVLAAMNGVAHLNWSPLIDPRDPRKGLFGPLLVPKPAAVSYAVAAHFLDDTLFVRDLWPYSRKIYGAIFKTPGGRKVAAVWAVGDKGSLTIEDAKEINAYDVMGGETGNRNKDRLEVPMGEDVVYLTSDGDQAAFIEKVQNARIDGITPVEIVAKPFLSAISLTPPIRVQVTNMLNRPIDGDVEAFAPKGWKLADSKVAFGPLEPGKAAVVEVPVRQAAVSPTNAYPVTVGAESRHKGVSGFFVRVTGPEWRVRREQTLFLAGSSYGTPEIDGDLSDWSAALPVQANTPAFISPWTSKAWAGSWTPGNLSAQFYTMYDEANFYVAARVTDNFHNAVSFADSPYNFPYQGDSLQLAFWPAQVTDTTKLKSAAAPDANRGLIFDTDYEYALALTPKGPEAFRLHTPQSGYTTPYPTNPPVGLGLSGAVRFTAKRDDVNEVTLYEAAIPWAELKDLPRNAPFHLAFRLNDRDREGDPMGGMDSAAGAGELRGNLLSFSPSTQYTPANLSDWVLLGKQ